MSESSDVSTEAFFTGLLAPAKDRLKVVRTKREKIAREIERLREEERAILKGIRAFEPTFEKRPYGSGGKNGKHTISDERLKTLIDFLAEHRNELRERFPQGWTVSDLRRQPEWGFDYGHASIMTGVKALHDRGVIRLDRKGRGGASMWVVV